MGRGQGAGKGTGCTCRDASSACGACLAAAAENSRYAVKTVSQGAGKGATGQKSTLEGVRSDSEAGSALESRCTWCDGPYAQTRSDQMYCCGACASKAWRSKKPRPSCKRCGQSCPIPQRTYCTLECRLAVEAEHKKRTDGPGKEWSKGQTFVPRQQCEICDAAFYAPPVLKRRGGGRFCSNPCRTKYIATHPELFPQTQHRRGRGGRRADLGDLYVRSSWEANWARYLNWQVAHGLIESWTYEPETFEFPIRRGTRFYTPDFRVVMTDGSVEYHEVKGWMDQKSATKLKRMKKYHPKVKIIVIDRERYRGVARQVGGFVPGWESVKSGLATEVIRQALEA